MKLDSAYAIPGEGVVSSFHSTPTHILIGLDDGKIHVLDTNGGHVHTLLEPTGSVTQLQTLEGHSSLIRSLYWAQYPDHQAKHYAVSGSSDGQIRVWDINSGHCVHVLLGHEATVRCLEVRGDILVSAFYDKHSQDLVSQDGEVSLHSSRPFESRDVACCANGSSIALLAHQTCPINTLRLHASTVIASTADGWLFAWSLMTYQQCWARKAHDHAVTAMDVYKGTVVSGGKDGGGVEDACGLDARVRVWNLGVGDGNVKEEDAGGEGASSLPEGSAASDKTLERGHDQRCTELGDPAEVVWRIGSVLGRLIMVMSKRGGVVIEMWTDEYSTVQTAHMS
ncbi:hypothetical protein MMC30_002502 [Trapelia coarctata]|nr:hypothetical protein [Trapelia coarctata]